MPCKEVVFYKLHKNNNYALNADDYIQFVNQHKPDTIVIINPNNPSGFYLPLAQLKQIVEDLSFVSTIIIDESFIHFAYENNNESLVSYYNEFMENKNVILLKSMSKDFGIAGLRAGYAVMNKERVKDLLSNGFLWNISGITNYFFKLYKDPIFQQQYFNERGKYLAITNKLYNKLSNIKGIKVLPSKANFF